MQNVLLSETRFERLSQFHEVDFCPLEGAGTLNKV